MSVCLSNDYENKDVENHVLLVVFQIILQLEGIVLKVIGIILQQNIMGMYVPFVIRLLFAFVLIGVQPAICLTAMNLGFVVIVKVVQYSGWNLLICKTLKLKKGTSV